MDVTIIHRAAARAACAWARDRGLADGWYHSLSWDTACRRRAALVAAGDRPSGVDAHQLRARRWSISYDIFIGSDGTQPTPAGSAPTPTARRDAALVELRV